MRRLPSGRRGRRAKSSCEAKVSGERVLELEAMLARLGEECRELQGERVEREQAKSSCEDEVTRERVRELEAKLARMGEECRATVVSSLIPPAAIQRCRLATRATVWELEVKLARLGEECRELQGKREEWERAKPSREAKVSTERVRELKAELNRLGEECRELQDEQEEREQAKSNCEAKVSRERVRGMEAELAKEQRRRKDVWIKRTTFPRFDGNH